jgi:hypothetical protein
MEKETSSQALLDRPTGDRSDDKGARQVSWLARVSPAPPSRIGSDPVAFGAGTPLTVAGAATDRQSLPCSLFTLFGRGTVHDGCPSFAGGCQMAIGRVGNTRGPQPSYPPSVIPRRPRGDISRGQPSAGDRAPAELRTRYPRRRASQRIGDLRPRPGHSAIILEAEKHMRGASAIANEYWPLIRRLLRAADVPIEFPAGERGDGHAGARNSRWCDVTTSPKALRLKQ